KVICVAARARGVTILRGLSWMGVAQQSNRRRGHGQEAVGFWRLRLAIVQAESYSGFGRQGGTRYYTWDWMINHGSEASSLAPALLRQSHMAIESILVRFH